MIWIRGHWVFLTVALLAFAMGGGVGLAGGTGSETTVTETTTQVSTQDARTVTVKSVRTVARTVTTTVTEPPTTEPPPGPDPGDCDENYDPCVPIDTDVDCEGGSGDGPSYVTGPVTVVGEDTYGLDSNYDDIGCE